MTREPGAKQTPYLLLVFLQAKMLRLGRCPKSPCDNPCGRGRISVIKTLLFTQCTDCFWSVFETERLEGGKEIKRLIWLFFCLALSQPASKPFSWNEDLWCTYCGPGGQENKVNQWRSALVQEPFSKHFTNVKKDTEQGCWTAQKYVTCLESFKTGFFCYFSENWLSKHLQTRVCSFGEEVLEYPEQKKPNHPKNMGGRCGAEKTEGKLLICQEAVTTFLTEKYISHHRGFFQLQ